MSASQCAMNEHHSITWCSKGWSLIEQALVRDVCRVSGVMLLNSDDVTLSCVLMVNHAHA